MAIPGETQAPGGGVGADCSRPPLFVSSLVNLTEQEVGDRLCARPRPRPRSA